VVSVYVPSLLKDKIVKAVEGRCALCELRISDLELNPLNLMLIGRDLSFRNSPKSHTRLRIQSHKIAVGVDWSSLFRPPLSISLVEVDGFKIEIEENHHPKQKVSQKVLTVLEGSYGGRWMEDFPEIVVQNLRVRNSQLTYILDIFKKKAVIGLSDISADLSKVATRKELAPRFANMSATGRLQESGHFKIEIVADLFSVVNEDKIKIEVRDQKMSELDSFFAIEDGIRFGGLIEEARADLGLQQGILRGNLMASYRDLSFRFSSTPETSAFGAMISGIVEKLKIEKTKPEAGQPQPAVWVDYRRRPEESLIQFLLAGLKSAAFKLISKQ